MNQNATAQLDGISRLPPAHGSANSIAPHAISRFRQRCGGKRSDKDIRRDIAGLLYSAEQIRYRFDAKDGSKYYHVDGLIFVVKDSVVVTVLFGSPNDQALRPAAGGKP